MAKITSKTTWTLELSDEEFKAVAESVKDKHPDLYYELCGDKDLTFTEEALEAAETPDAFSIGDHVVLVKDHYEYRPGDLFEVSEVDGEYIEVFADDGIKQWINADKFSHDEQMSVADINDEIKRQFTNNELSHSNFIKLLKAFSK
jgi:hypothetical protein